MPTRSIHKTMTMISAGLFLNAAGCAAIALTPGGAEVRPVTAPPQECDEIGLIYGAGGGRAFDAGRAPDGLVHEAIISLRNQAAEMGATHVLVSGSAVGGTGFFNDSPNAATVIGGAYRCGQKPPPPPPSMGPLVEGVATVRHDDGRPGRMIRDVMLTFESEDGSSHFHARTYEDGFRIHVPPGKYRVRATHPDYVSSAISKLVRVFEARSNVVNISLKPRRRN